MSKSGTVILFCIDGVRRTDHAPAKTTHTAGTDRLRDERAAHATSLTLRCGMPVRPSVRLSAANLPNRCTLAAAAADAVADAAATDSPQRHAVANNNTSITTSALITKICCRSDPRQLLPPARRISRQS